MKLRLPLLSLAAALMGTAFSVSAASNVPVGLTKAHAQAKATIAPKATQKLNMTYGIKAFYLAQDPANNYYFVCSNSENATYDSSSGDVTATDAFVATFDLYAAGGTSEALVEGTYTSYAPSDDENNPDFTYNPEYTLVLHKDLSGEDDYALQFTNPITVVKNSDGGYTITTTIDMGDDNYIEFTFTGKVPLGASSTSVYPSFKEDIDIQMTGGCGFYYGNLMENHTGNWIIRLFNCDFADTGSYVADEGICFNMMFFTKYISESQTKYLEDGTYTIARSLERGTIFPGMEVDYSDTTVPYGCYVWAKNSKYNGGYAYGYIIDGTMTIKGEEVDGQYVYDITIEGVTDLTYSVKATYHGTLTFEDKATYSSGGTITTLTDDVEMDLSPIKTCRAYNGGTYTNQEGVTVQSFILDIGSPSGLDSGTVDNPTGVADIIRIEFLCPQGTQRVAPGTYTVLDNDYTQYFQPYAARQGYFSKKGNGELVGTRYNHYQTGHWLVFDEYAPAMAGSIGVSKTDDDIYTFDILVKDDGEYYISGSWTGPMTLGYDPNGINGVNDIFAENDADLRRVSDSEFSFSAPVNWAAYTTYGAKVAEGTNSTEANLSNLSAGIYLLKYNNQTQKVVIK